MAIPRSSQSSIFTLSSGLKAQDILGFIQDENPPCTGGLGIVQGLEAGLSPLSGSPST